MSNENVKTVPVTARNAKTKEGASVVLLGNHWDRSAFEWIGEPYTIDFPADQLVTEDSPR